MILDHGYALPIFVTAIFAVTAGCLRPKYGVLVVLLYLITGVLLFKLALNSALEGLYISLAAYSIVGSVAEWALGFRLAERRPRFTALRWAWLQGRRIWWSFPWRRVAIGSAWLALISVASYATYELCEVVQS